MSGPNRATRSTTIQMTEIASATATSRTGNRIDRRGAAGTSEGCVRAAMALLLSLVRERFDDVEPGRAPCRDDRRERAEHDRGDCDAERDAGREVECESGHVLAEAREPGDADRQAHGDAGQGS